MSTRTSTSMSTSTSSSTPTRTQTLTLALMLLAVTAAFSAQAQTAAPGAASANAASRYKSPKLSRADFDALVARPEGVVIIDVRRPDEHSSIGAFPVFLSIQNKDLEKSLAYIPRERQIVTVSNHAARGLVAADLLAARGFKVAGAIGVQDYEAEGGTLVKVQAPPPRAANAASAPRT